MSIEWGLKGGLYIEGGQAGSLKNWTLTEVCAPSQKGAITYRKVKSWKLEVLKYLLKENITGKEVTIKLLQRNNYFICKGKLIDGPYVVGEATKGPLKLEVTQCQVKFK